MAPPDFEDKESTKAIPLSEILTGPSADGRRVTATLTAIAGRSAGKVYRLDEDETLLGRVPEVHVVIEDDGVSRRHASIVLQKDGAHVLADLNSLNGTVVNGTRIEGPVVLRDGDRIRIGAAAVFKFGYQDELEEQMQAKLYDSATRDPLTGAYNRRFFTERLASEWSWSQRHERPLALIAIDADHFKRVNDTYMHQGGDYVLREIVQAMLPATRREDLVARVGGEEFMVLARATERERAMSLAERIRASVEAHRFEYNGARIIVTISLGVSTSDDLGVESPEDLVGRADEFLYRAKENGRNRVEPSNRVGNP
jgi:diguanylate cyclase (GGDEF)-like protein